MREWENATGGRTRYHYGYYVLSHSSRFMPARASISFNNGIPMSSEWGFGIVSLRFPFVMK